MAPAADRNWLLAALGCLALSASLAPPAVSQAIANGSFETGNLSGWTVGGVGRADAVRASSFDRPFGGFDLPFPDDTWAALLSTHYTPSSPSTDLDGNGVPEYHVTTLSQTFSVSAAPVNLSLSWLVLTDERRRTGGGAAAYDDLFSIDLSGTPILRRSVYRPGGASPWTDTPAYNGIRYRVSKGGSPVNGSDFQGTNGGGRMTAFSDLCVTISQPGTYTLTFTVADQGGTDSSYDSALMVDKVELPSSCVASPIRMTDTSGANVEVKSGGVVFNPHFNRQPATSDDGSVIAFVSNANLTSDNPNAVEQVFTFASNVYRRLTSFASGTVGRPSITRNGRFVAFASNAPAAGNPDGNSEIYRYDTVTSTLTQVTNTTGCTNGAPSISDDPAGSSIFFETTCNLGGANSNGNREIARWTGDSTFLVTAGSPTACTSHSPHAAWGTPTTAVFVSTCGFTGAANADGNAEIFRWVAPSSPGTYTRITNTTGAIASDAPSITADGAFVSFVSNANLASSNADGSFEVFRWQSGNSSFVQATNDASGLVAYTSARIGGSNGNLIATERLSLLSGTFETSLLTVGGGEAVLLTSSDFTLPAVAAGASPPAVVFQSSADLRGENPDRNLEIWASDSSVGRVRTYTRTLPPLAILQCGGYSQICECTNPRTTTDDLVVSDPGTVGSLVVSLVVTHTYVGDLIFRLTHVESGTTVTLLHRPLVPDPNPTAQCGCSNDNLNVVFDDAAATAADGQCSGNPAINGRFRPYTPLSAFAGAPLAGTWRLTAVDMAGQDTGSISSWGMTVTLQ
ncbi:MAG TPA: proprotein convertase P-domain-containing protein [Thermoanaerobaculia bacterium]|nr:proprotein convertase P-domain-containing protein [Thermoanaerobaculia bacterium]